MQAGWASSMQQTRQAPGMSCHALTAPSSSSPHALQALWDSIGHAICSLTGHRATLCSIQLCSYYSTATPGCKASRTLHTHGHTFANVYGMLVEERSPAVRLIQGCRQSARVQKALRAPSQRLPSVHASDRAQACCTIHEAACARRSPAAGAGPRATGCPRPR